MRNANSGYVGYRMSKRAVDAYDRGERPFSKWSKADMLDEVEDLNPSIFDKCKKLSVSELRYFLLQYSSWHHTSSFYNSTDFYAIREDIKDLKPEDVPEHEYRKKDPVIRFRGSISYLEWSGTKRHPKATKKKLENVDIEIRGTFYVVFDDSGKEILRKKIESNGTYVVNYEEEKIKKERQAEREMLDAKRLRETADRIRLISGTEAADVYEWFLNNGGVSVSSSGNIYQKGRIPSPIDYSNGLEFFHRQGEKRLAFIDTDLYEVQIFSGKDWVSFAESLRTAEKNDA